MKIQVEKLQINYKTLDEFKKFRENGLEELSMMDDIQANIMENYNISPFFGVYDDGKLVARMSLYRIERKYDRYFTPAQDHYELWKLEVLPGHKGKGYGSALVRHAQTLGLPIKTNCRCGAHHFFVQLGFSPVKYDPVRDRGENPYIWEPQAENQSSTK